MSGWCWSRGVDGMMAVMQQLTASPSAGNTSGWASCQTGSPKTEHVYVFFNGGKASRIEVMVVSVFAIIVSRPNMSIMKKKKNDQTGAPLIVVTANG